MNDVSSNKNNQSINHSTNNKTISTHNQESISSNIPYQHKTVELSRGLLSLTYQHKAMQSANKLVNAKNSTQEQVNELELDDLIDFAERINPKRAFLFVSKVLGRHIPVAPSQMRAAFTQLAQQFLRQPAKIAEPIVVIGMAETAVGLSAGVHQVIQTQYPNAILLNSTRHAQDGQLFTTFNEDHSHASKHLIYQSDDPSVQQQLLACQTLVMVDDEASTGQTCKNVVNALRQAGLHALKQVHLLTLVDWSLDNISQQPFADIAFFRHHLLAGNWQWTEKNHNIDVVMPKVNITAAGSHPLFDTGNWGRFPTKHSHDYVPELLKKLTQQIEINQLRGKKVLVLGSNEFVWLPFLLAESLENSNSQNIESETTGCVKFASLTRSPINLGAAIKHKLSFKDNYGLGMINFVYNVEPNAWDVIILCIETGKQSVDKLWRELDNVLIVSPE